MRKMDLPLTFSRIYFQRFLGEKAYPFDHVFPPHVMPLGYGLPSSFFCISIRGNRMLSEVRATKLFFSQKVPPLV